MTADQEIQLRMTIALNSGIKDLTELEAMFQWIKGPDKSKIIPATTFKVEKVN